MGNEYIGLGIGMKISSVGLEIGFEMGDFWDYKVNASITLGSFNIGASIGTSGIGLNFGITKGNTTYEIGGTIGWGTIAVAAALAVAPVPGSRIVAFFTLLFGWLF